MELTTNIKKSNILKVLSILETQVKTLGTDLISLGIHQSYNDTFEVVINSDNPEFLKLFLENSLNKKEIKSFTNHNCSVGGIPQRPYDIVYGGFLLPSVEKIKYEKKEESK